MSDVKIVKKAELSDPFMIAGWPGMGSVALGVVDYLRRNLSAVKFAEIDLDPSTTVDSVVVERGLAKLPPPPKNVFYYTKKPDMIICEGEAQIAGPGGAKLLDSVLGLASEMKVRGIYTGAAFPMPVSYKDDPELYCASNRKPSVTALSRFGIKPMDGGHISGLNGLMLAAAGTLGIDATCLLATMPQYAVSLPNPKASRAILDALQRIFSFKVDLGEMDEYVREMDEKMALIEEKVKDVFPVEIDGQVKPPASLGKKVPGYIMEKIEKLFAEAKLDRSKAVALKKELDRWDLYKIYEDRFLDLFKDIQ